jgi:predicted phosphodiesterase
MKTIKKLAIISDVHGNSFALEAVLADIKKKSVDEIVFLGDMIHGVDPAGTFDQIEQTNSPFHLKGNAEFYLFTPPFNDPPPEKYEIIKKVESKNLWIKNIMGPERMAIVARWEEWLNLDGVMFVHDTPQERLDKNWHNTRFGPEYQEMLLHSEGIHEGTIDSLRPGIINLSQRYGFSHLVSGHTHASFYDRAGLVNVYTVPSGGMPLDGDPRPGWLLLEQTRSDCTGYFQRVDYNLKP